jgi:hypothetical protein
MLTLSQFSRRGGKARARKLTPERRKEIAKKAAIAMHLKRRAERSCMPASRD